MSSNKFGEPWSYNIARTMLNIKSHNGQSQVGQLHAVQMLVALRIVHCVNACAGLTDEQVVEMRKQYDTRTPDIAGVKEKLREAIEQASLMCGTLYGGYAVDVVDTLTAALALLEGGSNAS